ncbi:MAG: hypothetical protein NC123_01170 [Butyrivibrio sp.]|nr:hypothetical protein [Acetatifactor muris]MCM1558147.1 hypothetical protein [Butyrivibrio sp.]
MNRKNLPIVLMLLAGAITCIITFVNDYAMVERLGILLGVLILFYLLGSILTWTLNYFDMQNEQKRKEEGEVIEKEADEAGEGRETQEAEEDEVSDDEES